MAAGRSSDGERKDGGPHSCFEVHGDGGLDEACRRPTRGAQRRPARLLRRVLFGAKMKLGGRQRLALSARKELSTTALVASGVDCGYSSGACELNERRSRHDDKR
jgi:hypothetical protein